MAWQTLNYKIKGVVPLIMHNVQLADPMNHFTKQIKELTSKRGKTEADQEMISKLEWFGGLYIVDGKPVIPGQVVEATLHNGAKKNKLGKQALAGINCPGNYFLDYPDPKKIEDLWNDSNYRLVVGVRIQDKRIMRCRPIFRVWGCTVNDLQFDDALLNKAQVDTIVRSAGEIGFMDWRPKFGRFEVENGAQRKRGK